MRIGILSDLHRAVDPPQDAAWHNPYDFAGVPGRVGEALEHFARAGVEVVVLAGDLVHFGDQASLAAVIAACSAAHCPVLAVAGNHDGVQFRTALAATGGMSVMPADEAGIELDGVRLAGVHVAASDDWFRARLEHHPRPGAWGTEPVVLISHYPMLSSAALVADHGLAYPGDVLDRAALADQLVRRDAPSIVLSGHVHARSTHSEGPVLQLTQGAVIEPPFDAVVVDVTAHEDGTLIVERDTRRLSGPRVPHEPVLASARGAWRFDGSRWTEASLGAAPDPPGGEAGHLGS